MTYHGIIWEEKEEGMCQNGDCRNFPEGDNAFCDECLEGQYNDDCIHERINEDY